jgi:hypothetical protein
VKKENAKVKESKIFGTVHFCLKAWQVIMWSASSVMMHALTGVNAL